MNEEISENVACVKIIEIMKTLVLLVICLCGLCGLVEGHGFVKIIIGKDTLNMYSCPIEQDSVLTRLVRERLVRDSFQYVEDYGSLWRLEKGKLCLEKIEKENRQVDISGIFDAYQEKGRIVAGWFSGELFVVGGESFYPYRNYSASISCGPITRKFETEITYTFRNGVMTGRKKVHNSLREQGNQMSHYTMGMLLNVEEMKRDRGADFDAYVYPKSDGTVDRVEVMCRKGKLAPDDPATREVYACAELIGDWRVVTLDGEIQRVLVEPVERKYRLEMDKYLSRACPDVLEMDGVLYRMDAFHSQERMYVYREDRGFETEKFIVVEQNDRNVQIFPKNYYSIRDSLDKRMFGWVDLLAVPFEEGEETIRENHPWNRWEKEMEKRVFGGGVDRFAKAVADSLLMDIMIDVYIYFDREGRIIVSSIEMPRPLFEVLPQAQWERMFYESMSGDCSRKILEKVMNSISLYGLNDEYRKSLENVEKTALECRGKIASGDTIAQRVLQEAFMLARKSRPKADYGRVCISKRYYGENNTMNSWCVW